MLNVYKLSLVITISMLMLIPTPQRAYAQWPPFDFWVTPRYENGRITYLVELYSQVDWVMTDMTFKIPLPAGTRFIEAKVKPQTMAEFDGKEITFYTPKLKDGSVQNISLVVEVVDQTKTIFTTKAWITWQGDHPGDYLAEDLSIDIKKSQLNWGKPAQSRLQIKMNAVNAEGVITYVMYVTNTGWQRMWDLKINVPLPDGTNLLSVEAPPPFVTKFDGREMSFTISEQASYVEAGPLKFKVTTAGVTTPVVVTHAWATWKNVGRDVGLSTPSQEETRTGDLIVQPQVSQVVIPDVPGDVPFANYDLTNVALGDDQHALSIAFHTVGDLGSVGQALEYILFIDSDCNSETGPFRNGLGLEYRVNYRHYKQDQAKRAKLYVWDKAANDWREVSVLNNSVAGKMISVWIPYGLLKNVRQFCWIVETANGMFDVKLPVDYVPDVGNQHLMYEIPAMGDVTNVGANIDPASIKPSTGTFIEAGDIWRYMPGWSDPDPAWNTINFDEDGWSSGPTSIGYGNGNYLTNLSLATPPTHYDNTFTFVQRVVTETGVVLAVPLSGSDEASVFMRHTFTPDPGLVTQLTLEVDYEGGFIAYLNGLEIARRNLGASGSPVFSNTLADGPGTKTQETIDLSPYINQLVAGNNVLAIQVHRSVDAVNLSVTPKLAWEYGPADIILPKEPEVSASVPVAPSTPPSSAEIRGKLAVPLDNGRAAYDVYIFSLPDGQEIARIPNARQPNFRFDGQYLLINREGGGVENVFEYNLVDRSEKQVSDAPQDWHPFYDLWGNRVVYGNAELTYGKPEQLYSSKRNKYYFTGVHKPFIFVQCRLLPPHQEQELRCRDIPSLGVLVPAGQTSEIQGTHPVWTSNDMIAYKGCNSWAGFAACGIYIVPSSSTKGFSDGFIPRQLTKDTSDTPTDTKGNLIAFMSQWDGNWEAYIMDLNGANVKNLSNNPNSNDGLPTISPDGSWVAFVSDRDGQWAVWVTSVGSGSAEKLFDLPVGIPWGDRDRIWTNERISWGP